MQYSQLSQFSQQVHAGRPLPFNIYDHDRTLLLARGHLVATPDQLQALLARGALIDIAELQTPAQRVKLARPKELPGLWTDCSDKLANTLRSPTDEGFLDALENHTPVAMALVERDPDLAIFQVLRQDGNAHVQYGVNHSIHAAITAQLVAQRLGWSTDEARRVFNAALTMNLAMLELQGRLAEQTTPLTEAQRADIQAHPELSRMLLELSGVSDELWLQGVAQHHESPDGQGYPHGLREPGDIAMLIRRADIYTAKLSPRAGRSAMAADQAGRQMFMQDPGHPMTAALVKEFGVYPPGCWVRLASGECGLVVRRGPTVMAPVVSVMTSPQGKFLPLPLRRDTHQKAYQVLQVLAAQDPRPKLPHALLMKLALA